MKKFLFTSLLALSITAANSQVTDFTFTDTDGNSHTLFSYLSAGKAVVIDPYFITCYYCQVFSPKLDQAYKAYGSNSGNVIFLGLEIESASLAQVDQYRSDYSASYPSCYDDNATPSAIKNWWGANIYPTYGGSFAQIYVIIPNTSNPGASLIEYSETGALDDATVTEVINTLTSKGFVPVGISDKPSTNDRLSLFPNPARNITTISLPDQKTNVTVEVYNLLGKKISSPFNGKPNAGKIAIPTSDLTNGYYFVKVSDGSRVHTLGLNVAH